MLAGGACALAAAIRTHNDVRMLDCYEWQLEGVLILPWVEGSCTDLDHPLMIVQC
jgi:hypothetical protein